MAFWLRMSILTGIFLVFSNAQSVANERQFRLAVPAEIVESGLLKHLLPRFSLKTQVKISVVDVDAVAEVSLGTVGFPVFDGAGGKWRALVHVPDHAGVQKFSDWITSEIGQRTIASFVVDGVQQFTLPEAETVQEVAVQMDGDATAGQDISRQKCGRCHVVIASERMNAIGSTPSFFALRSLPDWDERFGAFYTLNPHPAFTQVDEVTPPFPSDRPSPIVPVRITISDLESVLAYVASLEPADLGAPLEHQ